MILSLDLAHPSLMTRPDPTPRRRLLLATMIWLAFAALYAGSSRGVFLYGDDILYFQVTEAIVERGEVEVTSPARRGDVARSIRGVDGGRYSKYGIGLSVLAIPFYGAAPSLFDRFELPETLDRNGNRRSGARVFGTGLVNAALGGATVALVFLFALAAGQRVAAAFGAACALGIATPWLHYAGTFLSEPLSGCGIALAFYGVARFATAPADEPDTGTRDGWLLLSGFAAGLVVATKVAHLVVLLPLAVWVLVLAARRNGAGARWRHLASWGMPFTLWLAAIARYDYVRFGNVFETGYHGEATRFSTPLFEGLAGLLLSPAKGLVWYCPLIVLAAFGWPAFARRNRGLAITVACGSVLHLLLIAKYYSWYGGDAWGPRLLVPLLPLWVLPLGEAAAALRRGSRSLRVASLVLVAASFAVSAASVLSPFDAYPLRTETGPRGRLLAAWEVPRSPVVHHLSRLPEAVRRTTAELVGVRPVGMSEGEGEKESIPDFAYARYGSHALLQWSRRAFALALILLVSAAILARRSRSDQKALLSSPPQ
ncbi:MAG: phospholipid carrier-dependent glycosyltransferase [Thermoanaerobaculia bacterium]